MALFCRKNGRNFIFVLARVSPSAFVAVLCLSERPGSWSCLALDAPENSNTKWPIDSMLAYLDFVSMFMLIRGDIPF